MSESYRQELMKTDKRKIKILFYSDCPFFGGCENMLVSLFNSLGIHQEFDIAFAYRYSKQYEEGLHSRLKLKINEIPLRLPTISLLHHIIKKVKIGSVGEFLRGIIKILFLKYWFFFYDILILYIVFHKIKPDILHINNGGYPGAYSCLAGVFVAKLAKVSKIIFVINNIIIPYNSLFRWIEKPIDKFVKNNTTVFITGSKFAGNKIRDLWNLPKEKVINIPNTVMPRPIIEPKESILKRLGITDNQIIIGNIALLVPRKGQRYLIEALTIVREKFDNFENVILIIVGKGEEKIHLKRLIARLKLERKVIFIESENNIFNIINIFDMFCLTSIEYEDFPYVILEAMSSGKPVIGTSVAGIPEQIEDGINGFVVKPKDAKGLSEAILVLLQNKDKRTEMGKKSLERFNSLFSYDKVIREYIRLYKSIVQCNKLRK